MRFLAVRLSSDTVHKMGYGRFRLPGKGASFGNGRMEDIVVSGSGKTLLSDEAFKRLSDVPPEVEWFADIQRQNTRDGYRRDVAQFMEFLRVIG